MNYYLDLEITCSLCGYIYINYIPDVRFSPRISGSTCPECGRGSIFKEPFIPSDYLFRQIEKEG